MAKSEIPSIVVVYSGCNSASGSGMEQNRSSRPSHQPNQEEFALEEEQHTPPVAINIEDKGGGTNHLDDEGRLDVVDDGNQKEVYDDDSASSNEDTSPLVEDSPALSSSNSFSHMPNDTQERRTERDKGGSRPSRVKLLVRSHAVHDDTSPPPDCETVPSASNTLNVTNGPLASLNHSKSSSGKSHTGRQNGSQGSSIESSSPALSRDSSADTYTDSSGIDLQQFIVDTLHKNQKDRLMLLKLEQDLVTFIKDNTRQSYKFPQMSSYNRMLVHRVAAFFGLDHNVDQNGTAIIVNKTKNTRIPDIKFREQIKDELLPEEPKKCILRRDYASFEDYKESPERQSLDNRRSKSIEEREEEYVKARARIFNQEEGFGEFALNYNHEKLFCYSSSQEDLRWTNEHSWSSTDSDSSGKPQTQQRLNNGTNEFEVQNGSTDKVSVLAKVEKSSSGRCSRPAVTKASSFGGISLLTRENGSVIGKDPAPRLTKAESFNVTLVSPSTVVPPLSTASDSTSPVNKSTAPTHLPVHSQCSSFSQSLNHSASTNPFPFLFAQAQPVQHLPMQLPNQPSSSWTGIRDANMTLEFTPISGAQTVVQLPVVDAVPPCNVILNHPPGVSYLADGAVYRQKNIPSQTLMVAPFQTLNTSAAAHATVFNEVPSASAPHQLQQPLQSHQQQQSAFQGAQTVLYIPYIPSHIHSSLPQQSMIQGQGSHYQVASESRQYLHDPSNSRIDLVTQMGNLNFLTSPVAGQQSQDPVSSNNAAEGVTSPTRNSSFITQGCVVPALKVQNFVNKQGNVVQAPVYFMPQMPYSPGVQPSRLVYPPDPVMSGLASAPSVGSGNQGVGELPSHMISQPSSRQVPGQQFMSGGVSLFSVSQNTKCGPSTPVLNYTVTSQAGSSTVTTTTTSVLAPSGIPLQIYPFANMLLSNPNSNTPLHTTTASGQSAQVTNMMPSLGGHIPLTTVPLYLMNGGNNNNVASTKTSSAGGHAGTNFCSQTPPSQKATSANTGGSNQTLPANLPCINYAYTPLQASHFQQPSTVINPGSHALHTSGQLNPNIMTSLLRVLRPGLPLVTNLCNNTAPSPPTIIPGQFSPSSSKPTNKSHVVYPLTNLKDFMAGEHLLNAGFSSHDLQKGAQSNSLQFGSSELHNSSGAIYRRGVPLIQGHPLQHQINPLMLPQQQLNRTRPTVGNPSVSSRHSKMRKQRNKGNNLTKGLICNTNGQQALNAVVGGSSILEVEGLPEGMKRSEVERYLEMVAALGARIQFVCPEESSSTSNDIVSSKHQVLAVFESETSAQSALLNIKTTKFQLRPLLHHSRGNCTKNF